MESFGTYIRNLREAQNMPQRKLCYELDMDVSILSKIENDNRLPEKRADEIITTIARLFDIPVKTLKLLYFSDKIAAILEHEKDFEEILEVSKHKLNARTKSMNL
jgi:transcriptional regulator with XRE-family HTH domain